MEKASDMDQGASPSPSASTSQTQQTNKQQGQQQHQGGGSKKKGKQQQAQGQAAKQNQTAASAGDGHCQAAATQQQSGDSVGGGKGKTKKEKQSSGGGAPPKGGNKPGSDATAAVAGSSGAGTAVGGGEQPVKSKAQLKAERRAIQEAQRAAKEEAKKTGGGASTAASSNNKKEGTTVAPANRQQSDKGGDSMNKKAIKDGENNSRSKITKTTKKKSSTIDGYGMNDEKSWCNKEREMLTRGYKIDEVISSLGFQYLHQKIVGADARCVALLTTLKNVISKYKTPDEKELSRDLGKNFLAPCIKYINDCRPLSTSMGNAIKHLKHHISQIPQGTDDKEAICMLHEVIDNFIHDNITKAAEAVAVYANNKIDDGDVILVYAASSLIGQVLKYAHSKGKQFRVIVVEGRPRTEGKTMLRYLVRCGIPCSYIYIGSSAYAMRETTKVFLGAAAMFAIGDMHSRAGNAMIAAMARANNIPVLVCCETYKFTDKVQLSSGNFQQQGRGKDLVSIGHRDPIIGNYSDFDLKLMNVMYDVTHSRYITAVVTELGMLPCTSVPVVLRRQEDKSL